MDLRTAGVSINFVTFLGLPVAVLFPQSKEFLALGLCLDRLRRFWSATSLAAAAADAPYLAEGCSAGGLVYAVYHIWAIRSTPLPYDRVLCISEANLFSEKITLINVAPFA